jgi:alpha,alpha-trehalase
VKSSVSTPEPDLDATFDHIYEYWQVLTRRGESLAFPLAGRFIKPGGFFNWFFYWDSYFTKLGLVVKGKWQLSIDFVEVLSKFGSKMKVRSAGNTLIGDY